MKNKIIILLTFCIYPASNGMQKKASTPALRTTLNKALVCYSLGCSSEHFQKDLKAAELEISAGAPINEPLDDRNGTTLLMIFSGSWAITEFLIAHNAAVNQTDAHKNTALHHLLGQVPNLHSAEILIAADADINAQNDVGKTPLMVLFNTVFSHTFDMQCVNWIIDIVKLFVGQQGIAHQSREQLLDKPRTKLFFSRLPADLRHNLKHRMVGQLLDFKLKNNQGRTTIEEAEYIQKSVRDRAIKNVFDQIIEILKKAA
jgi:hypothetical protein